jgi:hypothetical protein
MGIKRPNMKTTEQLQAMSLDEIRADLGNTIYESALYFERLEMAGLVIGNGHNMAQAVSKAATDLLNERWVWK